VELPSESLAVAQQKPSDRCGVAFLGLSHYSVFRTTQYMTLIGRKFAGVGLPPRPGTAVMPTM
jgi:hypothetical protein